MAGHHNKDVGFVCWVGDRTGSCFSSLGSPALFVPVPCFMLLASRLTIHHGVLQIEWSYSATHKPPEDLLMCHMICCAIIGDDVCIYDVNEDKLQCLHGGDGVFI